MKSRCNLLTEGDKAAPRGPGEVPSGVFPSLNRLTHFAQEESEVPTMSKFFKVIFNLNKVAVLEKKSHQGAKTCQNYLFSPVSLTDLTGSRDTPSTCAQNAFKCPHLTQLKRGNLGPGCHLETFHKVSNHRLWRRAEDFTFLQGSQSPGAGGRVLPPCRSSEHQ